MGNRKKRGYYPFVSTLFVPKSNRGKIYNIKNSWLPITDSDLQFDLISETEAFKKRAVFPALNEKNHAAIAVMLDLYAVEESLESQSTLFRFRPHAFDQYEEDGEEDASINQLRTRIRSYSLSDRVVIESHNQSESVDVLNEMLTLMENMLGHAGIPLADNLKNTQMRYRVSALLATYPFLAFALFDHLPQLNVLYMSGEIRGVRSVYALVRPAGGELLIDESWMINDRIMQVVA